MDPNYVWIRVDDHVWVKGSDYDYYGWVVTIFHKRRSGKIRCVVEDDRGRLFIHNLGQVHPIEGVTYHGLRDPRVLSGG